MEAPLSCSECVVLVKQSRRTVIVVLGHLGACLPCLALDRRTRLHDMFPAVVISSSDGSISVSNNVERRLWTLLRDRILRSASRKSDRNIEDET